MRAIAAMSMNRVIGKNGTIPWHFSEDMKWFRKLTSDPYIGGYLLMGRKTFESLGVLPNRFIYILTNDKMKCGLITKNYRYLTEEEFNQMTRPILRTWVCGGASVYEKFIHQCSEVYLTLVLDNEIEGDAFMPEFEHLFPNSEIIKETKHYWFLRYWK